MLIGQKVTNITVFGVVSLADAHTMMVDFRKEWCINVYATF